ncbi:MAG: nuclear transport factor 2 family protein [Myxococcota bacterium]
MPESTSRPSLRDARIHGRLRPAAGGPDSLVQAAPVQASLAQAALILAALIFAAIALPACATRSPASTAQSAAATEGGADLAAAIAEARELESIRTTLQQYAMFLDDGRVADFLDLFTQDAVFTADEFTYDGRDAIRTELAEKPRGPGKHLPFPALIELDSPTSAHAWSDFLRVKIEREGDPTSWVVTSMGRYYDRLTKGADGRWRFSRRDVYILAMKNRSDLREPSAGRPATH